MRPASRNPETGCSSAPKAPLWRHSGARTTRSCRWLNFCVWFPCRSMHLTGWAASRPIPGDTSSSGPSRRSGGTTIRPTWRPCPTMPTGAVHLSGATAPALRGGCAPRRRRHQVAVLSHGHPSVVLPQSATTSQRQSARRGRHRTDADVGREMNAFAVRPSLCSVARLTATVDGRGGSLSRLPQSHRPTVAARHSERFGLAAAGGRVAEPRPS